MTPEEEYRFERMAAVACGAEGDQNCRHVWNSEHPDNPVTEREQREFEARLRPAAERFGLIGSNDTDHGPDGFPL